jgi:ATP-binding cassette subfamily B (MDR/TAP) protein 1
MIHVMGGGEVLESGTHDDLLSKGGSYSKLVAAQKLREAEEKKSADESDDTLPEGGIIDQGTLGGFGGAPLAKSTTRTSTKSGARSEQQNYDLEAAQEIPLGRKDTSQSLASAILKRKQEEGTLISPVGEDQQYSMLYLFKRMGIINREALPLYLMGAFAACCTGAVYPAFGIVYAKAVVTFQDNIKTEDGRRALRHDGDRNALWFFVISIGSSFFCATQNYLFSRTATMLTNKLRAFGFMSILRQDIEFFDQEKHSTGALTSGLSDNPQKVNGLAGITLGAIVQSCSTIVTGMIIGLIYGAKLAAVGIACIPFVVSAGYVRLRVVVLKDQANKTAHEESAHMACEAAGAIRTVASLTREQDCLRLYSESLKAPLKRAYKTNTWSTGFFALSQSLAFFAIALVFWYGSRLVSTLEYDTNQFFVCLMTITFGAIQAGK